LTATSGKNDLDWEWSFLLKEEPMQYCSFTTMFCRPGSIKLGKQTSFLILKINLKGLQLIQRWQKMIQLNLPIHIQGIPLVSNAHIFIFYYRIDVI
jgi:hypothetical protein